MDTSGNVYAAEGNTSSGGEVVEIPAGGGSASVLLSGLAYNNFVGFDGAGNLWTVNYNGSSQHVLEEVSNPSNYINFDISGSSSLRGFAFYTVPEPATLGLVAFSVMGVALRRKRPRALANA